MAGCGCKKKKVIKSNPQYSNYRSSVLARFMKSNISKPNKSNVKG